MGKGIALVATPQAPVKTHPGQFRGMRRHGSERRLVWLGDIHCEGGGEEDTRREESRDKTSPVYTQIRGAERSRFWKTGAKCPPGAGPISGEMTVQPRWNM